MDGHIIDGDHVVDVMSGHKSPNGRSNETFALPSGVFCAAVFVAIIATSTAFAQPAPLMPLSPTYADCSNFARNYDAYYKEADRRYMECWAKENNTTTGGGVVVAKQEDPLTECWNPHGPRCGAMARQACDVLLRRDKQVAQCRIHAEKNAELLRDQLQSLVSPSNPSEVEETAEDIIDSPGRVNQAVDAAGYARDVYNHVTRPQQNQAFPVPPLTPESAYADEMTDAATSAVRNGTRNSMNELESQLREFDCPRNDSTCKRPVSRKAGTPDPRTCGVLGTCDQ